MVVDTTIRSEFTAHATPVVSGVRDADALTDALPGTGLRPVRILPVQRGVDLDARVELIPPRGSLGFVRLRPGADALVAPSSPAPDRYIFAITLGGHAQFRYEKEDVAIAPRASGFVPSCRSFRTYTDTELDQVFMIIDRRTLDGIATALLSTSDLHDLDVTLASDISPLHPEVAQVIVSALTLGTASCSPTTPGTLRKIQEVAIETALLSIRSFRERLPRQRFVEGRVVRRAVDFMRANFSEPMSVADIARNASTSPRALQMAFKSETGLSPTRWLRAHRLDHAHMLLTSADASELRIIDVAHDSGFLHMGDFSRYYVERFGETPRVTKHRSAP